MRRWIRAASVVACCVALAACSTSSSVSGLFGSQPKPAAAPPPAPPPQPPKPQRYTGLTAVQLRVALGTPAFVRKDGTDELWRYDGPGCKAFFFLYPNGDSLQVRHVETLPRGDDDEAADPNCLAALHARVAPTS